MPEILIWTLVPGFGITLVIFGFAPPFVLRLILLMYPRDDPRRSELMAELRALPRRERPIWVAEQLESGLFEGLGHRLRELRSRRRRQLRRAARLRKAGVRLHIDVNVFELSANGQHKSVRVEGYRRNDGTWVETHYRRPLPPAE